MKNYGRRRNPDKASGDQKEALGRELAEDVAVREAVAEAQPVGETVKVIGVRFKQVGKIYYFDPDGADPAHGKGVIVETSRGVEYGTVAMTCREVPAGEIVTPLKKLIREATPADEEKLKKNHEQELRAREVWAQKIKEHGLEMDLVDVEYTFDNSKMLFYFTADGRIDFRAFVKDVASVFRTRIELRQIGVRDEAKQIGGCGACGREFCCRTFLGDFQQVSIKMAKEQNLSLNSAKLSGACGRLMCCLRYESDVYAEEIRKTPPVDSVVTTPDGSGVVVECNVLAGLVKVRMDNSADTAPRLYSRDQVKVTGKVRRSEKRQTEQIDEEELKKLQD